MSTNSMIGYMDKGGAISAVYCHWDGYLSHVGKILTKYYTDPKKVKKLISMGSISSLRKEIDPKTKEHTFNNPEKDTTIFYHRDGGEPLKIDRFMSDSEMIDKCPYPSIEFFYLFDMDKKTWEVWEVNGRNSKQWRPLK